MKKFRERLKGMKPRRLVEDVTFSLTTLHSTITKSDDINTRNTFLHYDIIWHFLLELAVALHRYTHTTLLELAVPLHKIYIHTLFLSRGIEFNQFLQAFALNCFWICIIQHPQQMLKKNDLTGNCFPTKVSST